MEKNNAVNEMNKDHTRTVLSFFKKNATKPPANGIKNNNRTIIKPPVPRWGNLDLNCYYLFQKSSIQNLFFYEPGKVTTTLFS